MKDQLAQVGTFGTSIGSMIWDLKIGKIWLFIRSGLADI